ncbi:Hypothetical protein, putative [Bodo saltans]|uniref:Uncharacterized protein n=1 Tax=Bodo saltans TaxID=75058 RepID=A0A0S4IJ44_BODSA|nr:Hypothetical protein, putative [Bodo saltans]|eukprot:CUE74763.1 Hypothetical protein, putative [Bodo saltans]
MLPHNTSTNLNSAGGVPGRRGLGPGTATTIATAGSTIAGLRESPSLTTAGATLSARSSGSLEHHRSVRSSGVVMSKATSVAVGGPSSSYHRTAVGTTTPPLSYASTGQLGKERQQQQQHHRVTGLSAASTSQARSFGQRLLPATNEEDIIGVDHVVAVGRTGSVGHSMSSLPPPPPSVIPIIGSGGLSSRSTSVALQPPQTQQHLGVDAYRSTSTMSERLSSASQSPPSQQQHQQQHLITRHSAMITLSSRMRDLVNIQDAAGPYIVVSETEHKQRADLAADAWSELYTIATLALEHRTKLMEVQKRQLRMERSLWAIEQDLEAIHRQETEGRLVVISLEKVRRKKLLPPGVTTSKSLMNVPLGREEDSPVFSVPASTTASPNHRDPDGHSAAVAIAGASRQAYSTTQSDGGSSHNHQRLSSTAHLLLEQSQRTQKHHLSSLFETAQEALLESAAWWRRLILRLEQHHRRHKLESAFRRVMSQLLPSQDGNNNAAGVVTPTKTRQRQNDDTNNTPNRDVDEDTTAFFGFTSHMLDLASTSPCVGGQTSLHSDGSKLYLRRSAQRRPLAFGDPVNPPEPTSDKDDNNDDHKDSNVYREEAYSSANRKTRRAENAAAARLRGLQQQQELEEEPSKGGASSTRTSRRKLFSSHDEELELGGDPKNAGLDDDEDFGPLYQTQTLLDASSLSGTTGGGLHHETTNTRASDDQSINDSSSHALLLSTTLLGRRLANIDDTIDRGQSFIHPHIHHHHGSSLSDVASVIVDTTASSSRPPSMTTPPHVPRLSLGNLQHQQVTTTSARPESSSLSTASSLHSSKSKLAAKSSIAYASQQQQPSFDHRHSSLFRAAPSSGSGLAAIKRASFRVTVDVDLLSRKQVALRHHIEREEAFLFAHTNADEMFRRGVITLRDDVESALYRTRAHESVVRGRIEYRAVSGQELIARRECLQLEMAFRANTELTTLEEPLARTMVQQQLVTEQRITLAPAKALLVAQLAAFRAQQLDACALDEEAQRARITQYEHEHARHSLEMTEATEAEAILRRQLIDEAYQRITTRHRQTVLLGCGVSAKSIARVELTDFETISRDRLSDVYDMHLRDLKLSEVTSQDIATQMRGLLQAEALRRIKLEESLLCDSLADVYHPTTASILWEAFMQSFRCTLLVSYEASERAAIEAFSEKQERHLLCSSAVSEECELNVTTMLFRENQVQFSKITFVSMEDTARCQLHFNCLNELTRLHIQHKEHLERAQHAATQDQERTQLFSQIQLFNEYLMLRDKLVVMLEIADFHESVVQRHDYALQSILFDEWHQSAVQAAQEHTLNFGSLYVSFIRDIAEPSLRSEITSHEQLTRTTNLQNPELTQRETHLRNLITSSELTDYHYILTNSRDDKQNATHNHAARIAQNTERCNHCFLLQDNTRHHIKQTQHHESTRLFTSQLHDKETLLRDILHRDESNSTAIHTALSSALSSKAHTDNLSRTSLADDEAAARDTLLDAQLEELARIAALAAHGGAAAAKAAAVREHCADEATGRRAIDAEESAHRAAAASAAVESAEESTRRAHARDEAAKRAALGAQRATAGADIADREASRARDAAAAAETAKRSALESDEQAERAPIAEAERRATIAAQEAGAPRSALERAGAALAREARQQHSDREALKATEADRRALMDADLKAARGELEAARAAELAKARKREAQRGALEVAQQTALAADEAAARAAVAEDSRRGEQELQRDCTASGERVDRQAIVAAANDAALALLAEAHRGQQDANRRANDREARHATALDDVERDHQRQSVATIADERAARDALADAAAAGRALAASRQDQREARERQDVVNAEAERRATIAAQEAGEAARAAELAKVRNVIDYRLATADRCHVVTSVVFLLELECVVENEALERRFFEEASKRLMDKLARDFVAPNALCRPGLSRDNVKRSDCGSSVASSCRRPVIGKSASHRQDNVRYDLRSRFGAPRNNDALERWSGK